jgi:hypothetical protein
MYRVTRNSLTTSLSANSPNHLYETSSQQRAQTPSTCSTDASFTNRAIVSQRDRCVAPSSFPHIRLSFFWPSYLKVANPLLFYFSYQALDHPYFFALPFPTHPSKLPKCFKKEDTPPLAEVDGNLNVGKKGKISKKRKLSSPLEDGKGRSIARRLDFTKPGSQ